MKSKIDNSDYSKFYSYFDECFKAVLERNEMFFFPNYTDHGADHIESILETSVNLMNAEGKALFTDVDAVVLSCSAILHDIALFMYPSTFSQMVGGKWRKAKTTGPDPFDDGEWPLLWKEYLGEVNRMTDTEFYSNFGQRHIDTGAISKIDLENLSNITESQKLIIGEFIRRHHARIAYEFIKHGIPTINGIEYIIPRSNDTPANRLKELIGLVARSHNVSLRRMESPLNLGRFKFGVTFNEQCHPAYIMVLLRIADYFQLERGRAPSRLLKVKKITSPRSQVEWDTHEVIEDITYKGNKDPEVVRLTVTPEKTDIQLFIKLKKLLEGLQEELDQSWAILGEVYGRNFDTEKLNRIGIKFRRIRSNLDIDELYEFETKAGYIPKEVRFSAANAHLLKLLVKPLYGDYPSIAVRELLQNSVDACRERKHTQKHSTSDFCVRVEVIENKDATYSLIVTDNGIGMSLSTLKNYFLNAGASFRTSMEWKKRFQNEQQESEILRSGKFGVGALAAFLIGEQPEDITLSVKTRHVSAKSPSEAIKFETSLHDGAISMHRCYMRNYGTIIKVTTKTPPNFMVRKKPEDWDWYYLKWPRIERRDKGKGLSPRKSFVPATKKPRSPNYHLIDDPDFEFIHWTYSRAPKVVCNGIKVIDEKQSSINVPNVYSDKTLFGSFELKMPNMSIFDKNGNLPLTLDRLRLDFDQLAFLSEIRNDVLNNLLAYLIVFAPERDPKGQIYLADSKYPGEVSTYDGKGGVSVKCDEIQWLVKGNMISFFDACILEAEGINHLIEIGRISQEAYLKSKLTTSSAILLSQKEKLSTLKERKTQGSSYSSLAWQSYNTRVGKPEWDILEEKIKKLQKKTIGIDYDLEGGLGWKKIDTYQEILKVISRKTDEKNNSELLKAFEKALSSMHEKEEKKTRSFLSFKSKSENKETNEEEVSKYIETFSVDRFVSYLQKDENGISVISEEARGNLNRLFEIMSEMMKANKDIHYEHFVLIVEIVTMIKQEHYKLDIRNSGFNDESSQVLKEKIPLKMLDDDWYLSEFTMKSPMSIESSEIGQRWLEMLNHPFIPSNYLQRKEVLSYLWNRKDLKGHFKEWEQKRTAQMKSRGW